MIYDKISNLEYYKSFNEAFTAIAAFLKNNDAAKLENRTYDLEDGIFANVSEYEPSKEDYCWEGHRKYADLQYIVSGNELIKWAPSDEMENPFEYSEKDDFTGCNSLKCREVCLAADAGYFAYFAPCDLHKPGLFLESGKVKKIVFKIPVKD